MKESRLAIKKLAIVTHVIHYESSGKIWAYGPYAREIELWADLFSDVIIASPIRRETPPPDCLPFEHDNIRIWPVLERGGASIGAKLQQVAALPIMAVSLMQAMRRADSIQVRCPGNIGLLGVLLAPLFSRYRIAKYAGQWNGYPGEALSYRLQRFLLKSCWWNAPVLVYGEWPGQPAHIVPFFTSLLNSDILNRAKNIAPTKNLHQPMRVLFVGRLSLSKNVHILIEALSLLTQKGAAIECSIVGEGPECESLERLVADKNLQESIHFTGGVEFDRVMEYYAWADVLVLASETEGWPKAISEAMAFGVVCIGSNRGLVPQMLASGRGLCVEPGDAVALADALKSIQDEADQYQNKSKYSAAWSQQFTIEFFQQSIQDILQSCWKNKPGSPIF